MKNVQLLLVLAVSLLMTMQSCSKDESEGCIDAEACNFNPEAELADGSCIYASDWFLDLDGDGYGNSTLIISDCSQPVGYTQGMCQLITFWADEDNDGLGDPNNSTLVCDTVEGYVSNNADYVDEVPPLKQRAVIVYQGATWSGESGAVGDPTKTYLEQTYGEDVIILNCQSADSITSATAFGTLFGAQFSTFYTPVITSLPHCYFSAANYAMTEHGFTSSTTQFNGIVDQVLVSAAKVGVLAIASLEAGVVTVHTSTKFASAAGEHFLGVYLLEDGVMEEQVIDGSANTVTAHNNVLRGVSSTASGSLGIESIGATFVADQIVENTYTIPVPLTVGDISKLQIGVVVWDGSTADKISNGILIDVN